MTVSCNHIHNLHDLFTHALVAKEQNSKTKRLMKFHCFVLGFCSDFKKKKKVFYEKAKGTHDK